MFVVVEGVAATLPISVVSCRGSEVFPRVGDPAGDASAPLFCGELSGDADSIVVSTSSALALLSRGGEELRPFVC